MYQSNTEEITGSETSDPGQTCGRSGLKEATASGYTSSCCPASLSSALPCRSSDVHTPSSSHAPSQPGIASGDFKNKGIQRLVKIFIQVGSFFFFFYCLSGYNHTLVHWYLVRLNLNTKKNVVSKLKLKCSSLTTKLAFDLGLQTDILQIILYALSVFLDIVLLEGKPPSTTCPFVMRQK